MTTIIYVSNKYFRNFAMLCRYGNVAEVRFVEVNDYKPLSRLFSNLALDTQKESFASKDIIEKKL